MFKLPETRRTLGMTWFQDEQGWSGTQSTRPRKQPRLCVQSNDHIQGETKAKRLTKTITRGSRKSVDCCAADSVLSCCFSDRTDSRPFPPPPFCHLAIQVWRKHQARWTVSSTQALTPPSNSCHCCRLRQQQAASKGDSLVEPKRLKIVSKPTSRRRQHLQLSPLGHTTHHTTP